MTAAYRLRTMVALACSAALASGLPLAAHAAPGTTVALSGVNEVPPNTSPATGTFTYQLKGQLLCYTLDVSDLGSGATASHIHLAPEGVVGPVAIPLTVEAGSTSFTTAECVTVDKELIRAIRKTPEGYYVNVHTALIPAGEIRAQLG